ncbi:toxin ETX/toxin MTX2 [Dysgonomonas alginatilytica]|uniref:Toxin ETX/toxin MTX2 n=1 Tax=Dysgonomonas alginatilytica TaxID=1605892 RepID=A0A2V3PU58_9BACT|nr:toxin ETX/toxin MTX2 [Dysgonomonas alginatilytica]
MVASPIDQLVGIPVNITLPSGVAESRRAYISTKKKDYTVNFNYEDDGSGRERWVISKYGTGYSLRALSCHNNNPYLYSNGTHPFLHTGPEKMVLQIAPTGSNNKFLITTQNQGTKYLYGRTYNSVNIIFDGNYPGSLGQWEIIPVEPFQLESISYTLEADDKTEIIPSFIDEVSVYNNGDVAQSMSVTYSKTATESSSFSDTRGFSFSVGASFKTGIPVLAEGQLNVTQTTTASWTYGKSETEADSRSYTFNLQVPAKTTYKAKIVVAMYKASATYLATYKSNSGRRITLTGKWSGVKAGKISYDIYKSGVLVSKMQK